VSSNRDWRPNGVYQCFSTYVRLRPGKFFFLEDEGPVPTNLLVNNFPVFFMFVR